MDLQKLSDAELVGLCCAGNQAAWSTLVRRFQRLVYTIPRRARLLEAACADVFQVTFTRLFEHIDRLDDPARVRAWLVTTARRETLRQLRAQQASGEPATSLDDDAAEPAAFLPWASEDDGQLERWHEIRQAVDRLEARCRQLIDLLFLSETEVPYAEIARRLGMSLGSIGPTRGRCLAHLRKLLQE